MPDQMEILIDGKFKLDPPPKREPGPDLFDLAAQALSIPKNEPTSSDKPEETQILPKLPS